MTCVVGSQQGNGPSTFGRGPALGMCASALLFLARRCQDSWSLVPRTHSITGHRKLAGASVSRCPHVLEGRVPSAKRDEGGWQPRDSDASGNSIIFLGWRRRRRLCCVRFVRTYMCRYGIRTYIPTYIYIHTYIHMAYIYVGTCRSVHNEAPGASIRPGTHRGGCIGCYDTTLVQTGLCPSSSRLPRRPG